MKTLGSFLGPPVVIPEYRVVADGLSATLGGETVVLPADPAEAEKAVAELVERHAHGRSSTVTRASVPTVSPSTPDPIRSTS